MAYDLTVIDMQPTADVVPRAEVDLYKKLNDELEDELASTYDKLENAKAEVAREIFKEIENRLLNHIADYYGCYHKTFDELKKKYIPEEAEEIK